MSLQQCWCPECGGEMSHEFRISIGGLFRSGNSWSIYPMLHDGVQPDWDKVLSGDSKRFSCIRKFKEAAENRSELSANPAESPADEPLVHTIMMMGADGDDSLIPDEPPAPAQPRARRRKRAETSSDLLPESADNGGDLLPPDAAQQPRKRRRDKNAADPMAVPAYPMPSVTSPQNDPELATMAEMRLIGSNMREMDAQSDVEKYLSYLPNEHVAATYASDFGVQLDLEHPYSENCRRIVWIRIIMEALQEFIYDVSHKSRMIPHLLSINYDTQRESDWFNMDLKSCFESEKITQLSNALIPLIGAEERGKELQLVNEMRALLDTADSFLIDFSRFPETMRTIAKDPDTGYPVDFIFGEANQSIYLRVCPLCGAHVSSLLGMYKQHVISFIGTPASGKSTLINSIYETLHIGGYHPHINIRFPMCDPNYDFYEGAYRIMHYDRLAVIKTNMGVYPTLTLLLEYDNKKELYTFVDVPGEHFIKRIDERSMAKDVNPEDANMHRLRIMKQSEVICVVVAAEQLMDINDHDKGEHAMASRDQNTLDDYVTRVTQFVMALMGGAHPPVYFIVTKPDAFPRDPENDFQALGDERGTRIWGYSVKSPEITQSEMTELYGILHRNDLMLPESDTDRVNLVVNFESLLRQQQYAHKMLHSMDEQYTTLLTSLSSQLTGSAIWDRIPLFMVSPFGFYALETAFKMSPADKAEALNHYQKEFLDSDSLLNADEIAVLSQSLGVDLIDDTKSERNPNESEGARIQREHSLSLSTLNKIFLKEYTQSHIGDKPYGVVHFVDWLLSFTGLYRFVCNAALSKNELILQKNAQRCGELIEYDPEFGARELQYAQKLEELQQRINHYQAEIEKNSAAIAAMGRVTRGLEALLDTKGYFAQLSQCKQELASAEGELDALLNSPIS